MKTDRLEGLDALRGIAALVVVIYHYSEIAFWPTRMAPFDHLYLAVDLFFLLSGFVMAHVYGTIRWRDFGAFLWARFARIYPVHLFMLAVMLHWFGSGPRFSPSALLASLALMQSPWIDHFVWNDVAWSISAEWHAYLVFPLLCAAMATKASRTLLAAISLAALAYCAAVRDGNLEIPYGPLVLLRAIPEFSIGMLLHQMYRSGAGAFLAKGWVLSVVAGGILVLTFIPASDFAIVTLLAVILLGAAFRRDPIGGAPAVALGAISYSLYMTQMPLYLLAKTLFLNFPAAPAALHIAVAIAVVPIELAFATAVSRRIERPARAWLRATKRRDGMRVEPFNLENT